jgi:hypothetical protein
MTTDTHVAKLDSKYINPIRREYEDTVRAGA